VYLPVTDFQSDIEAKLGQRMEGVEEGCVVRINVAEELEAAREIFEKLRSSHGPSAKTSGPMILRHPVLTDNSPQA
jgi:hypothetical protein